MPKINLLKINMESAGCKSDFTVFSKMTMGLTLLGSACIGFDVNQDVFDP